MGAGDGKGALGCSANIAKLILIIFNLVFFLAGLGILGLSIWLLFDPSVFHYFKIAAIDQSSLGVVVYVGIAIGALIFILGFLGCCGACRQSVCMLSVYSVLLIVIVLLEVAAIVLAILFKKTLETALLGTMEDQVKTEYKNDTTDLLSSAWNFVQWEVKCCGANNYTDYRNSTFVEEMKGSMNVSQFCCKTKDGSTFEKPQFLNSQVCQAEGGQLDFNATSALFLNTQGCYSGLLSQVNEYSFLILLVVVLVIFIEILLVVFACCLCKAVKDNKVGGVTQ